MASKSKALQTQGAGGCGCLWLFGGIFIVAGGAVFWLFSVSPLIQLMNAKSWVETPCIVELSRLDTFNGDDGDTYAPHIEYSYSYGDGDYDGDRYTFSEGSSSGRNRHQAVVDRYPVGSTSVCYVNPDAPEESVLTTKVTGDYFFGFVGLLFVGAGGLVIFFGGRQANRNAAKSSSAKYEEQDAPEIVEGPVILKSQGGPIIAFIGVSIFAIIWNGIVGTICFGMIAEGDVDFVAVLFMTPFVLVGLLMLTGAGYYFLAMFNPRVQLSVNQSAARLGTEIELDWTIQGSAERIDRLRISLEGREQARYTRGTSTYTDNHTFMDIEIIATENRSEKARGRMTVAIPEFTMHSFDGGNNEIIWEINVKGEIARWPDVNDSFEYTVLPLDVTENS